MAEPILPPLALALTYLRLAAGWTKTRLALALGFADESLISAYERGVKHLPREQLDSLVEPMSHSPDAVDALLFAHGLIFPELDEDAPSPIALSPEERWRIDCVAMAAGRTAAEQARRELKRRRKLEKTEAAQQEAKDLYQRLMALPPKERSGLAEAFPDYWSWALAVRVCEASVRRAAHKAAESLDLAELALSIAERVPGEETWRSRLKGYCWAHIANARRVANDLAGAEEAFARAWKLWQAGAESAPGLLAEWRLYDLEASLRRAQRRFSEALELLDWARAKCGDDPIVTGRILLNRERVFNQQGDVQSAFETLMEAAPLVEASGDSHLIFALRFNMADDLCHLQCYGEALEILPRVRELAVQQANELDLIRFVWLESKVAAGQGRVGEAIVGLEQVSRDFTHRELPYDAALSSLDLSMLWLKSGRTAEVQELTVAMGWIFNAKGIDREALAALKLFCDAAQQEEATVELTRRVIAEIEKARRSASSHNKERDRE